jgi:hypothetical protein
MKKALLIMVLCFSVASPLLAQTPYATPTEYKLLQPLPLDGPGSIEEETTTLDFLPRFIKLIIGLATALAVVMVIYGGFQYILTAAPGGKSSARETIENAIWGLLLAIGAWLILYTVNPKLVELNLNIEPQEIRTTTGTSGGGGGPTGTGACSNCVTFDSLGIPTSGSADGKSIAPYFGQKLAALNNNLKLNNISWNVTEGYPPSVAHKSGCHNIGTCVDANISSATPANINKFAQLASAAGLGASYEVKTTQESLDLIKSGVNPIIIRVNADATGRHFHIK